MVRTGKWRPCSAIHTIYLPLYLVSFAVVRHAHVRVAATTSKFPKPTRVGWVASGAHQVGRGEDGGGRDQADVEVDSWVGVRAQR